ncbi:hypothetical protein NECAME_08544 [Necator americanus]|uniref:Neurotransmitter-gated ion-channel ligand-binding domain-containing protein n=1 Tax=Necator americanus TaxID=51031 RepID=W2TK50_NECAM|nr:hypothetical protein NECAME_08544 [Necator americanus]ETN81367.1 hypothetical protein NECAME_08544 [Necator americanus]
MCPYTPHSPSRLLSNGKFTKFDLKAHSISFILEVQTDKKRKKGNSNRVDTFVCEIKQFPTGVNPDSAEFEMFWKFYPIMAEHSTHTRHVLLYEFKSDHLAAETHRNSSQCTIYSNNIYLLNRDRESEHFTKAQILGGWAALSSASYLMIELLDEKNQVVDVNAWLKLTWHDYSLIWDPKKYDGVTDLSPMFSYIQTESLTGYRQDEKNQVVDVNAWLKLTWHDYSLIWDPKKYDGVTDLRFKKNQVWTPDVLLYNSADPQFDSSFQSNVLVYPDGVVNWIPPGLLVLKEYNKHYLVVSG